MMNNWIISSSVMIAAVLAVRFLLRGRISLRLQYALWAVVLLRLLIPFQIFLSPFFSTGAVSEQVDLSAPVREVYFSANEEQYERQYDATYHETVRWYESKGKQLDPAAAEQRAAEAAQQSMELNLNLKLFNLWIKGMALMTAVIAACNLHLALRLKRSRTALDIPGCLLGVYTTAAVPTPCVFGFFRPAVYLTPGAAENETVLRHALTHELIHYRHLDHVWSALRSLCLVLHWYNPLVWIAAKVSRADAELACDEGALRVLGESQRSEYGRTLIDLTCGTRIGSIFLAATTMTGSACSLRERIKLLMQRPRNTVMTVTVLILMVTLIVGCTFADAPADMQPPETTQPGIPPEALEKTAGAPAIMQPPETTQPGIPPEVLEKTKEQIEEKLKEEIENDHVILVFPELPTETTSPGVDNDMSYQDQELPIPEAPAETVTTAQPVTDVYAVSMQEAMEVYTDKHPRKLTAEEIDRVNEAFAHTVYDAETDSISVLPVAAFFTSYYDDVRKLNFEEFLRYFPISGEATEEEFQLLLRKYGDDFLFSEFSSIAQMPVPVHRYETGHIDGAFRRYANLPFLEFQNRGSVYYLEETGCFYNFTSDFGPGMFPCVDGFVYDGGAILYTKRAALYLRESGGRYGIYAHLPILPAD